MTKHNMDFGQLDDLVQFIHGFNFTDIPADVVSRAELHLLDLIGAAAAGTATPMSTISRDYAATYDCSGPITTRLLFDGRPANAVGAAFAGAATIDSFDSHDGHNLTKGHVGVTVLPALAALLGDGSTTTGAHFLALFVLGYEVGNRAGIALHASACDYHSSGAWNALAAVAIGARHRGLTHDQTLHALGIAEFFGPRSPLMRDIDYPTMVKDGSAQGAKVGVEAVLLAEAGFTGAPATTVGADSTRLWSDLGERWHLTEQYMKAYPVCRWAHPAIEAVLDLRETLVRGGKAIADVDHIRVSTFHAAVRLATRAPADTEQAQYSLPFPVASAFVHGELSTQRLIDPSSAAPDVVRLAAGMQLCESPAYEQAFPDQRWADATLVLTDGSEIEGPSYVAAPGSPDNPFGESDIREKYRRLAATCVSDQRVRDLEAAVAELAGRPTCEPLLTLLQERPYSQAGPSPAQS